MNTSSIRKVILDLAVDDSFAPSEIVSRIRQEYSELSDLEAKKLAKETVIELLALGLIEVTRLEKPSDPEIRLNSIAATIALEDDLSWIPFTSWRSHIRVVATADGREAYYEAR